MPSGNADNGGERLRMTFDDTEVFRAVCGRHHEHLKLLERKLGVRLSARGNRVTITGESYTAKLVENLLRQLYQLGRRGYPLYPGDVERAMTILSADRSVDLAEIFMDTVYIPSASRFIAPKGLRQKEYIDAIRKYDIVFGVGPAGTGKTYLAMAMGVSALMNRDVQRIILTRPAVEAGERLGFLPGDLMEKVNPYLRPLYDALHDMMDLDKARSLVEQGAIEIAPLAFMRGRTLNDSFVILDEAQNTTLEQMKMFLTRLGFHSRAVITGDVTQIDLPEERRSGLVHALSILDGVEDIYQCRFQPSDVVRHPLVQAIIHAYDRDDARRRARRQGPPSPPEPREPAEAPSTAADAPELPKDDA